MDSGNPQITAMLKGIRRLGYVRAVFLFLFPPLWLIVVLPLAGEENWITVFVVAIVAIVIGAVADAYRRQLYLQLYATLAELARATDGKS